MADAKLKDPSTSSGSADFKPNPSETDLLRRGGKEFGPGLTGSTAREDMPEATSHAVLSSKAKLDERQELVRIISNRLLLALVLILGIFIIGGFLVYKQIVSVGATNMMVLLCGAIGGFVSVQQRLKDLNIKDLTLLARSWVFVLLSPLVGGILASLLYFLFVSGLLTGELFPAFKENQSGDEAVGLLALFSVHCESYADYAKIIFWCFLAGYSESFVTNIINHFESSAQQGR